MLLHEMQKLSTDHLRRFFFSVGSRICVENSISVFGTSKLFAVREVTGLVNLNEIDLNNFRN